MHLYRSLGFKLCNVLSLYLAVLRRLQILTLSPAQLYLLACPADWTPTNTHLSASNRYLLDETSILWTQELDNGCGVLVGLPKKKSRNVEGFTSSKLLWIF